MLSSLVLLCIVLSANQKRTVTLDSHLFFVFQCNQDEDKNERGKILLSLFYSKITCNFHVRVLRGSQLLPMDFGRTSDPYCKLYLYPTHDLNNKCLYKTSVKKHSLNPEFNEEFVFSHVQFADLIGKTLRITVYDRDVGKKDDYIGKSNC